MQIRSKYFLSLFTFLLLQSKIFAYDGVVIVLEAPLLKEPDINSVVLQTVRKGERVYVPREVVVDGEIPEYVPTFDRAGNRAYVPGRFLKVVLGTVAENKLPVTLPTHDPTDYRLEEPIPSTYPYEDKAFVRATFAFLMANNTKSPYAYGNSFSDQNYKTEMGGRFTLMKKVDFDKYDRFYFGFIGFVTASKNSLSFKNNNTAEESRDMLRAGPWFTYDAFKNDHYRLSLGTGLTFNYHKSSIFVDSGNGSEERLFSGYSISPMVSTNFQVTSILPYTDFVGGMDLSLFLPHSLKTKDAAELPSLWGDSDQIDSGLRAQASVFLGVQIKY